MITAKSESPCYRTFFSDGTHDGVADAPAEKGGANGGFLPFELLEAALASCVNITVRMFAESHNLPLEDVTTTVALDRTAPDETRFRYDVELHGQLTPEQRQKLLLAAQACPIRRLLSKTIQFQYGEASAK